VSTPGPAGGARQEARPSPPSEPPPSSEVRIRQASEAELSLVRDSWVKSYRKGALKWLAHTGDLRAHVSRLIARSRVLVAEVPEVPEAGVIGWVAVEGPTVHYAYVLRSYRGNGVYRELLAAAGFHVPTPVVCSHYTASCERMKHWVEYRPSLLTR